MAAQQPAFDLGNILQGLTQQAAFGAAQFGLPQGQNFNFLPPTAGQPAMPQTAQPQGGGLWNALGYAGDVLGAISNSGEGGWAGSALGSVVKRRNAQSYNQALQQSKMAEVLRAYQAQQNKLTDYNRLTGQQFVSPEVAEQYSQLAGFPLMKEQGMYGLDKTKGQEALQAWDALQGMNFGATGGQGGTPPPQSQVQQPAFQAPVNGYAMQSFPTGNQFSAGATQTELPDYSGIPVTPDTLGKFTDVRNDNLSRDETARKNRQDETLRQQQINNQRNYQQGQLDIGRQNAYTARVNSLSYDQKVKLKKMENAASKSNPTKVSELKRLAELGEESGGISMQTYIDSLTAPDPFAQMMRMQTGGMGGQPAPPTSGGLSIPPASAYRNR